MKVPDLGRAIENGGVFGDEVEGLIEPFPNREGRTRKGFDKSGANSVALRMPLVFLRDSAADAVESSIERAVAIKRANETAEKCGDGDSVS